MKVPHVPESLSVGGLIYSDYRRGLITAHEYCEQNAALVGQNLHWYSPKLYSVPTDDAARYIHERSDERTQRDPKLGREMGAWADLVFKQKDDNDANLSLLLWALSKLHRTMAVCDAMQTSIDKFGRLKFPMEMYSRAMRVQVLDLQDVRMTMRN